MSAKQNSPEQNSDITLVHGAMHGEWVWDYLRPELHNLGHTTAAPNLPIDERLSFDDMAEVIADGIIERGVETDLALHSRAGNWGIRVPDMIIDKIGQPLVKSCVYIGVSLQENTVKHFSQTKDPVPSKSSIIYTASVEHIMPKLTVYDQETNRMMFDPQMEHEVDQLKELLRFSFYKDCTPDIQDWALEKLRPQYYSNGVDETPVKKLPDIPSTAIVLENDSALLKERQFYSATHWSKSRITTFESGHSPMLSRPQVFAKKLSNVVRLVPVTQ